MYDDFNVGGPGWAVSGVFFNVLNAGGGDFNGMNWEIRSGVSTGNGGTVVASGSAVPTVTLTGGSGFGFTEYKVHVGGLSVNLAPGTYWLGGGVTTVSGSNAQYMSTTSGTNAIGTPPGNNGNSFWNSTTFGANFLPTSDAGLFGAGTWDIGMGVEASPVPEPASMIALGTGIAALVARRRRKIAKA